MLTSSEHQAVQRTRKANRNAAARERRGSLSRRLRDVTVIDATLAGEAVLVAVSHADPHRAAGAQGWRPQSSPPERERRHAAAANDITSSRKIATASINRGSTVLPSAPGVPRGSV